MYFLKGTPFIYQGQEIGMTNMDVESLDEYVDIECKNVINTMKSLHIPKKYMEKSIKNGCRDNSRTPMQWDDSKYAGFSEAKPWLKVNSNKSYINVKKSLKDENSILNFYKKLIKTYKQYGNIIRDGVYKDILPNHKRLFAYERRENENKTLLVISNFSANEVDISFVNKYKDYRVQVLLNNYKRFNNLKLLPYQSVLLYLDK